MKSYLEFVYVFHCCVCICCAFLSSILLNQYIHKSSMIISILICNFIAIGLYAYLDVLMVLIIESVCIYFYARKFHYIVCVLALRYSVILCMYIAFGGSVYHGIYYMHIDSYQWIIVSILLSVFTYFVYNRCKLFGKLKEYNYRVKVEWNDVIFDCYGYWDSGNFANLKQIPIIFLHDERLKDDYVKGFISGIHIPKQEVYVVYMDHDIQNIYPCLLNQLLER